MLPNTCHRARPALSPEHPVHVTLRMKSWVPALRLRAQYFAIHRVLARVRGRADFRVVHASIQNTHVHLLVEAADRRALSRGMLGLSVSLSRALGGQALADRYHAVAITSSGQARRALAYVLNNWRHHREDFPGGRPCAAPVDPYASGLAFDGWTERPAFTLPEGYEPLPTSPPRTALLRDAWRGHGLIDPFERPGAAWP